MPYTDISENKWELVFNQRFESPNNSDAVTGFLLPQIFYRHLIKVHFIADQTPANWYQAGSLIHRLDTGLSDAPIDYEVFKIPQNRLKVIKLDPLSSNFRLEFSPLKRYLWFTFKLWYHIDYE